MRWWRRIPWFKALGAVLLFGSWIAQNYYGAAKGDELAYLNQAQLLISVEEGHFSVWLSTLLIEQQKDKPSSKILKDAALKAAQHQLNILTWATARVTDPGTHQDLLTEKRQLQERIAQAYKQEQPGEIIAWLNALVTTAESRGPALVEAFAARYARSRDEKESWNTRFLILYILGTLLVAIGAGIGWLRHADDSGGRMPNHALQRTGARGARPGR